MLLVLASPRFLFRVEDTTAEGSKRHPLIDEYALASRLSYFLWSTMPDEVLFRLAEKRQLRRHLGAQVKRMLADKRSDAFVENFVGQWLQTRDVAGVSINARWVLGRDRGEEGELERLRREAEEAHRVQHELTPTEKEEAKRRREYRRKFLETNVELDTGLRTALRQETERSFAHVARNNRSVLELVDSGYTFANEKLARYYGIEGVTGNEMRLVALPPGSPRGGVLTQASVLIVTSNPTRTSPVKRGLFVLDNILGIPPPV
jgi:hypothetical protein